MTRLALGALLWWLTGVAGFTFWWTNEHDFTPRTIPMAAMAGSMGPFAWLAGWGIHGNDGPPLIRARNPEVTP